MKIDMADQSPEELLHKFSEEGDLESVKRLVEGGVDVDAIQDRRKMETPLHVACKYDHLEVVKYLVEQGANLEALNSELQTILHYSCMEGDGTVLEFILGIDGHLVNQKDSSGSTPMLKAAQSANKQVFEMLLNAGADISLSDTNGSTPLLEACFHVNVEFAACLIQKEVNVNATRESYDGMSPLFLAVKACSVSLTELLLANGADMNIVMKKWGTHGKYDNTILHVACEHQHAVNEQLKTCHVVDILRELLDHPSRDVDLINVNSKNSRLSTPLHVAITNRRLEAAKFLVERGADLEAKEYRGRTPLLIACDIGSIQAVEYLLGMGADKCAKDTKWYSAVFVACKHVTGEHRKILDLLIQKQCDINVKSLYQGTALHKIISMHESGACIEMLDCMVNLLLKNGADLNAVDAFGDTVLHLAIRYSCHQSHILVENGADINAVNQMHETPLHIALSRVSSSSEAKFLVENGADVKVCNIAGETAMHVAARFGNAGFLVENGADLNVVDKRGNTPLHTAAFVGLEVNLPVFLGNGAYLNVVNDKGETPLHTAVRRANENIAFRLIAHGSDVNAKMNSGADVLECAIARKRWLRGYRYVITSDISLHKTIVKAGAQVTEEHINLLLHPHTELPSSNQTLLKWMQDYSSNPKPLADMCRLRIRKSLVEKTKGCSIASAVEELPLPEQIKKWLLFDL